MESKAEIIEVEKSCLRLVARAISDNYHDALKIFREETDLVNDVAEDVTREALGSLGMSRIQIRLYGKIDYKRAAYLFLPEREVKVALMVDSKAEKDDGDRHNLAGWTQCSVIGRRFPCSPFVF